MALREHAMLILQRGNQSGRVFPLDQPNLIIGRSEECTIVLDDRQVSRQHARIFREGDRYFIADLGSKNGTHVNGRELTSVAALQDGDEIQIALRFKLAFVDMEQTAPLVLEETMPTGLRLEPDTRQVFVGNQQLTPALSLAQYRLLELLVQANGGVVTRDDIASYVWPEDADIGISEQAIGALVRRLRERIADLDDAHPYILTVRGHGFRLQNPE